MANFGTKQDFQGRNTISNTTRLTIPNVDITKFPVQPEGSTVWDELSDTKYMSDGLIWIPCCGAFTTPVVNTCLLNTAKIGAEDPGFPRPEDPGRCDNPTQKLTICPVGDLCLEPGGDIIITGDICLQGDLDLKCNDILNAKSITNDVECGNLCLNNDTDLKCNDILNLKAITNDVECGNLCLNNDTEFGGIITSKPGQNLCIDAATDVIDFKDNTLINFMILPPPMVAVSYGHIKDGNQNIATTTATTITDWTIAGSAAYHTIGGWDLTTGIYTASVSEKFEIDSDITWSGGVSNLGMRTFRIVFFDDSAATTTVIKEVETQADPDINTDTTQHIHFNLQLDASDTVLLEVEHNAPIALTIAGGIRTTMSGQRVI